MGTRLGSVSRRHEPSVAHVLGEELNSIVGVLGSKESLFSEISIVPCWSSAGWLSLRTPPPESPEQNLHAARLRSLPPRLPYGMRTEAGKLGRSMVVARLYAGAMC